MTLKIVGQFTSAEWRAAQQTAASRMRQSDQKLSLLIIVEDFQGFKEGKWNDSSFQVEFDKQISKMAIVGEQRWEDLVLMFVGKGLRRIPIEYFLPGDIDKARQWLQSK